MKENNKNNMLVSSISAKELPLSKIFCSDYSFLIPSYQRPYSWKSDHALQLLDDISNFALKNESFNKLSPYFVGSLVLIKKQESRTSKVVDGQQRLITFTILFSVLRFLTNDLSVKSDITKFIFEPGSKIEGTINDYRIKIRERDQNYFNTIIQEDNGLNNLDLDSDIPDSQNHIRINANAFIEKLNSYTQEDLIKLSQFLAQKCFLVVVTSTDEDSAFRIFNVLNDRGLQLSHADILKSEVLEKISSDEQDDYNYKWENAEEYLGVDRFKELFNQIRPIYAKKKAEESILKEIRKYVKPAENPKSFIDNILIPYAEVYNNILECNYSSVKYAEEINKKLNWLNRFENTDWIPSTLLYISKNKITPNKIYDFLCQLERLALGLEILNANVNRRIERYASLNLKIEKNDDIFANNDIFFFSSDEIKKIQEQLFSNSQYGKRYLKILLLKIDEKLSGGGASYNYPIITIEHILPQTPKVGSQWTNWFNDDERKDLVNTIGNLVLLTNKKNPAARNFEFDKKKEKYFKVNGISPFTLTTSVLNYFEWKPDIIKDRTKEMANYALGILNLPLKM